MQAARTARRRSARSESSLCFADPRLRRLTETEGLEGDVQESALDEARSLGGREHEAGQDRQALADRVEHAKGGLHGARREENRQLADAARCSRERLTARWDSLGELPLTQAMIRGMLE